MQKHDSAGRTKIIRYVGGGYLWKTLSFLIYKLVNHKNSLMKLTRIDLFFLYFIEKRNWERSWKMTHPAKFEKSDW